MRRPVCIVTGTTHGIGLVTARELVRAGRHVVMLCRDLPAAQALAAGWRQSMPGAEVDAVACDLGELASVRQAAETVRTRHGPIDLLVNNAGRVCTRPACSVDGFELTFAVNHLGPFLLTGLLLDRLPPGGRIVNVASRVHRGATLDLAALRGLPARYRPVAAYARSKFANVLHTFALARRLRARGVTANCLHPGVVASNLLPPWLQRIKPLVSRTIDVEAGARTSLHLALSPALDGVTGAYFDEFQACVPADARADDVALQEALWAASAEWCGWTDITAARASSWTDALPAAASGARSPGRTSDSRAAVSDDI